MEKNKVLITDLRVGDPLCRYFDYKNIEFDFLPEFYDVPLVDIVAQKIKGAKDVILLLGIAEWVKKGPLALKQLYEQRSVYNDFLKLRQRSTLIIYGYDTIVNLLLHGHNDSSFFSWLNNLEPLILTDGKVSEIVKKHYEKCEFIELPHPFFDYDLVYPELSTLKNHAPKTDFLCLMADNKIKPFRRLLNENIIDNGLQKNMIYRFNNKSEKTFDDLLNHFPKKLLDNMPWKDGIPSVDFYNQTNLELGVETICGDLDDTFFITEKTIKPIMMKHPFMMLANKNFLKNLRELGFKTFHEHLDESYDQEPMMEKRIHMIIKNLVDLKGQTHKLYEETKEIREHNHRNLQRQSGEYRTKFWQTMDRVWSNI